MSTGPKQLALALIAVSRDLAQRVSDEAGGEDCVLGDTRVLLSVISPDAVDSSLASADGILLLIRHLDSNSLDQAKALLGKLPNAATHIAICRAETDVEFKMSCPSCRQKLWIRDADVGRNGRCPHCKIAFVLPSPEDHLRSVFEWPNSDPLLRIIMDRPVSCRDALEVLANTIVARRAAALSATKRIQLSDDPS